MYSPVIAKIMAMQQTLTVSENEIAQYVINNTDAVVSSTITTVAQNTDTSEASINRFCKKIGYKGFNSFKVALAQENFYNSMQDPPSGAQGGFVATVSADYRNMLMNTTALLDESSVVQAANTIRHADHIFIFSLPQTSLVAQEFELKLSMLGLFAQATDSLGRARILASSVGPGELVIAVAPSILVPDLYQAVSACKERGATLITITSYDSPKLGNLVDHKFIISDKIATQNSLANSNDLMFLYVLDVLYCALLGSDRTLKSKRLNSDAILNSQQQQRADHFFYEF